LTTLTFLHDVLFQMHNEEKCTCTISTTTLGIFDQIANMQCLNLKSISKLSIHIFPFHDDETILEKSFKVHRGNGRSVAMTIYN